MIDREQIERLREHCAMEVNSEEMDELFRVYLAWLDAPELLVNKYGYLESDDVDIETIKGKKISLVEVK